jgi:hypothetical protein
VWRALGERIDDNSVMSDRFAERVWTEHPSRGSQAFKAVWKGEKTGGPPGGVAGYPAQVSAYCRRVAEGCEAYAEAVDTARRAVKVMALTSYSQLLLAASWPWIGARTAALSKWLLDRLAKKIQAGILLKLLENAVAKIALEKLTSYTIGSAVFALGDEALALGSKAAFGADTGSVKDNAMTTLKDFAACLVFFGVWDLTKIGRVGKAFPENDVGDFASFYVGSTAYTVTYNLEDGKTGTDVLPTYEQFISKLLIGTSQRGKDPGYSSAPTAKP